jgi:hypothetical protein
MAFLETSALDATNVEKAFDVLLEGMLLLLLCLLTRAGIHERVGRKLISPNSAARTISTDGVVVHAPPNGPAASDGGGCMSSC